jgi:cell division transport system permease protein
MKNDWRLHALSVFSVSVAFVCLAAALLVVVNVEAVRDRWQTTGRASVYMKPDVSRDQVAAIERALRASEGVTSLRFVSSEAARNEVVQGNGDEMLAALPAEAFPASLEVELSDEGATRRLNKMAGQLEALPAVETVETYEAWSERIARVLTGGMTASLFLAIIVLCAVVSVVSSTMRLALQRRRREVEVLKLVGASDSYVTRPFLVEGALQGGLGAAVAVSLLAILYAIVRHHFDSALGTLLGVTPTFLPWSLTGMLVALGAMLGLTAAFVSLKRFLVV